MRADRLIAALLMLQTRGQVTATELAIELEVSVATARRDLEALSTAGLPVYAQAGRGGGWRLLGGGRTDLSGLSSTEVQALFLLLGPASRADGEARAALRKLVRALPETFRAQAEAAADATHADPEAWQPGGRADTGSAEDFLRLLQDAIIQRRRVSISYEGWNRPEADELVDPWRITHAGRASYLLGSVDGVARTFRVDRIRRVRPTMEPSSRPSPDEINAAWAATSGAVQQRTSRARASFRASPETAAWLRAQFAPGHLVVSDGLVTVTAPTTQMIARVLTGWADQIEDVEPPEVQAEMHRIGTAAATRS